MRLTWNRLIALAALAAAGLMAGCSADSPGPTSNNGGGPGANGLVITLTATPNTPTQGTCSLVIATATLNGVPVASGTSIQLSASFGVFSQNGLQTISLVTQNGSVETAICSNAVGPATITGTVIVGSSTARNSTTVNFLSNGIKTTFISICADPHTGPVTGGTPITITGGGFGTAGATIPVIFRSGGVTHQTIGTIGAGGTTITAITPAFPELANLPATPVEIDVLIPGQTLVSPACFTYTTAAQPIVTAILPASGTKVGGTRVTITGSGFAAPLQVFFGGTLEAQVLSVTPTQIVALTPPANGEGPQQTFPQTVNVVVQEDNCSGTTCTSGAVPFTYTVGLSIFGFTPDHGDNTTTITITGQGFVAPLTVSFGSGISSAVEGTVLSVSGTQILAKPPQGCPSAGGFIFVTLLSDGETTQSAATFTVSVPTISANTSPSSGPGGTATAVTIIGTGLFPSTNASAFTITAGGGSISSPTVSQTNGQQTVSFTVTPDVCSPTVTLLLINTATGCSIQAAPFTNSTFNSAGPTASPSQGTTTAICPTVTHFQYTASFSALASTTGTPNFTYAWVFANSDGTAASPGTGSSLHVNNVTFTCPDTTPCSGTATLTVTDQCGKSATSEITVTPPAVCP